MSTRSPEVVYKWSEHVPSSTSSQVLHVLRLTSMFVTSTVYLRPCCDCFCPLPFHCQAMLLCSVWSKFAPMFASSYAFSLPSVLNVFFVLRLSSAFTCNIRCYMPYRQVFSLLPRSCIWLFCQTTCGPLLCPAPALLPSCLRKYEW